MVTRPLYSWFLREYLSKPAGLSKAKAYHMMGHLDTLQGNAMLPPPTVSEVLFSAS